MYFLPRVFFLSNGAGLEARVASELARRSAHGVFECESACTRPALPAYPLLKALLRSGISVDTSPVPPLAFFPQDELEEFDFLVLLSPGGTLPLPAADTRFASALETLRWDLPDTPEVDGDALCDFRMERWATQLRLRLVQHIDSLKTRVQTALQS